jgi:hypothetical protein
MVLENSWIRFTAASRGSHACTSTSTCAYEVIYFIKLRGTPRRSRSSSARGDRTHESPGRRSSALASGGGRSTLRRGARFAHGESLRRGPLYGRQADRDHRRCGSRPRSRGRTARHGLPRRAVVAAGFRSSACRHRRRFAIGCRPRSARNGATTNRLRNLVQRTRDVTVVRDLGVPRSTACGWLRAAPTVPRRWARTASVPVGTCR